MIFQDQSIELIRKGVFQLRNEAREAEDKVREKLKDFYWGRQFIDLYLADWGFKNKTGRTDIPKSILNITRKVIDKISLVYKYAPDRRLDIEMAEGEDVQDPYSDWVGMTPRLDVSLKTAERQKNLLNKCLFRPVYNKVKWNFFIETEYDAHFTEDDRLNPFAYSWPIKQDVNSKFLKDVRDEWWRFWSDEFYFMYNLGGEIKYDEFNGINPYGKMPFIELMDGICVDEYPAGHGAIELVAANEQINVALMNLNQMIHFQAFDQPYLTGIQKTDADKLEVGPHKYIVLPQDSTAGLLSYSPKIMECVDSIHKQIELIAWTYNLSISWGLEGSPASGFSLLIKNIDLLEAREDDVELAVMQEKELYQVLVAMQKYYKSQGLCKDEPSLPENTDVIIDFADIQFPVNQQEELDRWKFDIDMNAESVVSYIMSKNPDMSEEEAYQKFQQNKKWNGKLSYRDLISQTIEKQGGEIKPGNQETVIPAAE